MHGVGRATGAITIVNALPLRRGSALGIDLGVEAEVLTDDPGYGPGTTEFRPEHSGSPIVRTVLEAAARRFLPPNAVVRRLVLASDVPVGCGLKSSSAVAGAVARAVANAAGAAPSTVEVAQLVSRASRESGVSATGAFDDALACLRPGVVVTDNEADRLLREQNVPDDLKVALWIPPTRHPPAPSLLARFAREADTARPAVERALAGDWPAAMEVNSELVERVMRLPYGELRGACRRNGAIASGVSGLGPAFAALATSERLAAVVEALPRHSGEIRTVRLSTPSPSPVAEEAR